MHDDSDHTLDDFSADSHLTNEADERPDRRRAWASRLLGWLTSGTVHLLILLALAAIFLSNNEEVERPPVRTDFVFDPPEQVQQEEMEMVEPVEVQITVEADTTVDEQTLPELELVDESDDPSTEIAEAPSIAEVSNPNLSPAIGGGAGDGGFSRGVGIGTGASVSFMGTKPVHRDSPTGRLLYIIDMSASLKDDQLALIKHKLALSLGDLTKMDRFNVVFFSGPCWLPGEDIGAVRKQWQQGKDWHDFTPLQGLPTATWERYSPSYRRAFTDYLTDLKRSGGTDWRHPFQVAYSMDPKPQCIFFLTDGAVNNSDETVALVKAHPEIPVHTIAFGVQDTDGVTALAEMASLTNASHVAYDSQQIAEMYSRLLQEQQDAHAMPK